MRSLLRQRRGPTDGHHEQSSPVCRSRTTFHFIAYAKLGVSDCSLNLRFDYLPANLGETTIQVRELERAEKSEPEGSELLGPAAEPTPV
jgi:hypothetical protein